MWRRKEKTRSNHTKAPSLLQAWPRSFEFWGEKECAPTPPPHQTFCMMTCKWLLILFWIWGLTDFEGGLASPVINQGFKRSKVPAFFWGLMNEAGWKWELRIWDWLLMSPMVSWAHCRQSGGLSLPAWHVTSSTWRAGYGTVRHCSLSVS